jgi:hypothetical protein
VSESTEGVPPTRRQRALRTLAHDLGNLAYRLNFLTENLRRQIPDAVHREEAVALLEDTAAKLRATIATLREEADHV